MVSYPKSPQEPYCAEAHCFHLLQIKLPLISFVLVQNNGGFFFSLFYWDVGHLVANLKQEPLYQCTNSLIPKLLQSLVERQNKPGPALQFWSCRSSSGKLWTPLRPGYQMPVSGCKHRVCRTHAQNLRKYAKSRDFWINKANISFCTCTIFHKRTIFLLYCYFVDKVLIYSFFCLTHFLTKFFLNFIISEPTS